MKPEIDYIKFGRLLYESRKRLNITQAQACEALEMSTSHYSNLELGKAQCSIATMISICNFYNLPIESSITNNYAPSSLPFDLYDNVSKLQGDLALEIAEHLINIVEG